MVNKTARLKDQREVKRTQLNHQTIPIPQPTTTVTIEQLDSQIQVIVQRMRTDLVNQVVRDTTPMKDLVSQLVQDTIPMKNLVPRHPGALAITLEITTTMPRDPDQESQEAVVMSRLVTAADWQNVRMGDGLNGR
jgi:hypothetical protein